MLQRWLAGTRWPAVLKESLGSIKREALITLKPFPRPQKWVFVVGCYNSGTTLLAELLAAHDRISGLPTEGQFLTDQFAADHELGLPRMWSQREDLYRLTETDPGPDVVRLKREWAIHLDLSKPLLLEKSPPNCARMRWLQAHFENAHFIAIVRDGYAVAEGISRKAEPRHSMDGWPLEMSARQWHRANEVMLEDAPRIERLHWVRYEDLTADPDAELAKIWTFLDLPATTALGPGGQRRSWAIHERNEPVSDMNAQSWRRLSEQDLDRIETVAGTLLQHFRYPRPNLSEVPTGADNRNLPTGTEP